DSLDMAVYLYENRQTNGLKVVDIIERTGLHRNALYRELEIRGIETTRAFSTDNIELAIELFLNRKENGYRLKDIKDKTGISKTTLYRELENRGIEFNNGNRKVSEEVRYKALSLYFERET
ncbi:transcriptional regulator, partial [Bacillus cereus]